MPRSDTTPQGQALRALLDHIIAETETDGPDRTRIRLWAEEALALQDAEPPAPTREPPA